MVVLVAILLVMAPLAVNVPLAALAAIPFVVAWNMSEARHFVWMARRAPPADIAILVVMFLLTMFSDLIVAVNAGIILSTVQFLRRMASSVDVRPQDGNGAEAGASGHVPLPEGVLVYAVEGPLSFAAVETFEQTLAATPVDPRTLIIRLNRVPFIEVTEGYGVRGLLTTETTPRVPGHDQRRSRLRTSSHSGVGSKKPRSQGTRCSFTTSRFNSKPSPGPSGTGM